MRFHFRWAATALFVVAAVRVPAAIRLFSGDQLGLIGMARRKAVLENYITKTTSRMNIVITLLLSLFAIWTNSVAAALIFLGNVFGSAVIALGQQRRAVWAYGIGMVLNFGLNLIFIPRFSYVAAATSTVLTEFVVTFGLMCICARASGGYIRTMRVLYALAASIVMAIPFMFLGDISHKLGIFALIPYLIICPALYILSLRMFRGITQEHIDLLRAHAVR